MVQWIKVLATKPEDLQSIPEAAWWKERTYSHKFSYDLLRLKVTRR